MEKVQYSQCERAGILDIPLLHSIIKLIKKIVSIKQKQL